MLDNQPVHPQDSPIPQAAGSRSFYPHIPLFLPLRDQQLGKHTCNRDTTYRMVSCVTPPRFTLVSCLYDVCPVKVTRRPGGSRRIRWVHREGVSWLSGTRFQHECLTILQGALLCAFGGVSRVLPPRIPCPDLPQSVIRTSGSQGPSSSRLSFS